MGDIITKVALLVAKLEYNRITELPHDLTSRLRFAVNDSDWEKIKNEMNQIKRDVGADEIPMVTRMRLLGVKLCKDNEEADL